MKQTFLTVIIAALVAFQQAQDTGAMFNRAVALQKQGRLAEAADEYRALLKLKPDYADAHANLGIIMARLGKYDEAVAAYESAFKLAPNELMILLNLGIAHYRAGKLDRAVIAFQQLLERRPELTQARQLYGLALSALGRDEEAVKQLEMTLAAAPQDAATLYSLGLGYLRLGKPGFLATLERLAAFPAGRPALHLLQGQAFLRDLEFEKALEELQSAARLNPDLPRLHFSLGLAHHQLGHNKEAVSAFEEEAKRNPRDFATVYYLADALEKDGRLDDAQRHVETALKLDSQSPEANGLSGKILLKKAKAADAVKPLEFAVTKKPSDPELRYTLARVYQQLGRREDAAREFAEVQKLKAEQLKKDRANTPKP